MLIHGDSSRENQEIPGRSRTLGEPLRRLRQRLPMPLQCSTDLEIKIGSEEEQIAYHVCVVLVSRSTAMNKSTIRCNKRVQKDRVCRSRIG